MKAVIGSLLLFFILGTNLAQAQSTKSLLKEALTAFKTGDYKGSIKKLDTLERYEKFKGLAHYWKGLNYNKLNLFDDAIAQFYLALKAGNRAEDIYYEFGQALYASYKLDEAYKMFRKSADTGYKKGSSMYYMAFMKQTQDKFPQAVKLYKETIDANGVEKDIKQAASFQIAQIYLSNAEKSKNKGKDVKRIVIPQLEDARRLDKKSNLAKDISIQITALTRKYEVGPGKMANGRPIPRKPYVVKFAQKFSYNSNVLSEADRVVNAVSQKGSVVHQSRFSIKNRVNYQKNYLSTKAAVDATFKYHQNRNVTQVKQQDEWTIVPKVENAFYHKVFKSPAEALFGIDYEYIARDNTGQGARRYFSRKWDFIFGEKLRLWGQTDTTFKFKVRYLYARDPANRLNALIWTVNDSWKINAHNKILGFFTVESNKYRANRNLDNRIYLMRADYVLSDIIDHFDFNAGFAFTIQDNLNQSLERGVEHKVNPSLSISRKWIKNKLRGELNWSYLRARSKNKAQFEYHQYIVGLNVSYKL